MVQDTAVSIAERTRLAIEERTATVGVVGLGYVGLPMLVASAEAGFGVVGFDRNSLKVEALRRGESYVEDVPDAKLRLLNGAAYVMSPGRGTADVWVIAVPTPLKDSHADLQYVISATEAVGRVLKEGDLVCVESTTYPGTTRELVKPLLESLSGMVADEQFFLAYSPERIDPGSGRDVRDIPKLLAGLNVRSTELAKAFYEALVNEVVVLSGLEEAEMAKLLENTYRQVNIALVNQLATLAPRLGVDFWEAMRGASTKPFGFMPFRPGPGVGGHCIGVDAVYLADRVRAKTGWNMSVVEAANEVNQRMPEYVVGRVVEMLNDQGKAVSRSNVLGLGIAYKPEVADVRESPALQVLLLLQSRGARVQYHDPLVPVQNGWTSSELYGAVMEADCVVLLTDHVAVDYAMVVSSGKPILDTRGVLPPAWNVVRL